MAKAGLGWEHQKRRKLLLSRLVEGSPCDECHEPMYLDQKLDADHSNPRAESDGLADRLLHASCNRRAGQRMGHVAAFSPTVTSRAW